jgi:hypothetical protein
MKWIAVEDKLLDTFHSVITYNTKDLHPVCAFYVPDQGNILWMRAIEGPEDCEIPGKDQQLYRPPTHWAEIDEMELPEARP